MMYDNQFNLSPGGGNEVNFACSSSGAAGCIRDCSHGCHVGCSGSCSFSCSDNCTWIQVFKALD